MSWLGVLGEQDLSTEMEEVSKLILVCSQGGKSRRNSKIIKWKSRNRECKKNTASEVG